MSFLIRIDQAPYEPMFVKRLPHRGGLLVTFNPREADRFVVEDEARLVLVRVAAAQWARPETVSYGAEGL
jgi:hypothetical protein